MAAEKTIPFKNVASRSYPWGVITALSFKPKVSGLIVPNLTAHAFWFRTRREAKAWARSNLSIQPLTWGIVNIENFSSPDQLREINRDLRTVFPEGDEDTHAEMRVDLNAYKDGRLP